MKRLSIPQAVALISEEFGEHITQASLQAWVRSGRCPFGEYIRKPGTSRGQYLLFRERIRKYFKPSHDIGRAVVDRLYIGEGVRS